MRPTPTLRPLTALVGESPVVLERAGTSAAIPAVTAAAAVMEAVATAAEEAGATDRQPARTAHRSFADEARRFERVSSIVERMTSVAMAEYTPSR
jgi:hypothetical protein